MTLACEAAGPAFWVEPASAWSSLAFVVAGAWIIGTARRPAAPRAGATSREDPSAAGLRTALGVLTVLVGVGSVVQHGPAPSWNPVVHDPPLLGAYALIGADAVADLTGRRVRTWWWLGPTLADVVLAAVSPAASVAAEVTVGVVAVGAAVLRAIARPAVRPRMVTALGVLAAGSVIGTMSRPGWPWCDPDGWLGGWLSGHAVWHVLASAALAIVAPAVGRRAGPPPTASNRDERL